MDKRLEETIDGVKKCSLHGMQCDYEHGLNEDIDASGINLCGYHGAEYLTWKLDGNKGGVRKYIESKVEESRRAGR